MRDLRTEFIYQIGKMDIPRMESLGGGPGFLHRFRTLVQFRVDQVADLFGR